MDDSECGTLEEQLSRIMERFSPELETFAPKSRYMGVSGNIYWGWVAKIRDVNLGTYDTEAEAALAYDDAAFRLRGRNAKLNFPNRSSKGELMCPLSTRFSFDVEAAMDFGSGVCVGVDTGELPSQSIALEENEESNMCQPQDGAHAFQQFPNVEVDWDAITSQEAVAVGNQDVAGDAAKELHVQDDGYAINAETQSSNFQIEKSPPHQETMEIEEDPLMLEYFHQLPTVEDPVHKMGLIVGAEKVDSCIHVLHKTRVISKEGNSSENEYSYDILSAHFGELQNDVAKLFNVSRSKFKRICRDNGIKRWRSHKRKLDSRRSSKLGRVSDEDPSKTESNCTGIPPLQDTEMITVKATYNEVAIKFELLDSSRMVDLENSVIERLEVERDTFSIKYQDDEGDWVLIACDKDLQNCIKTSRLSKRTTIKMLVDRPIKHYAS